MRFITAVVLAAFTAAPALAEVDIFDRKEAGIYQLIGVGDRSESENRAYDPDSRAAQGR